MTAATKPAGEGAPETAVPGQWRHERGEDKREDKGTKRATLRPVAAVSAREKCLHVLDERHWELPHRQGANEPQPRVRSGVVKAELHAGLAPRL